MSFTQVHASRKFDQFTFNSKSGQFVSSPIIRIFNSTHKFNTDCAYFLSVSLFFNNKCNSYDESKEINLKQGSPFCIRG